MHENKHPVLLDRTKPSIQHNRYYDEVRWCNHVGWTLEAYYARPRQERSLHVGQMLGEELISAMFTYDLAQIREAKAKRRAR